MRDALTLLLTAGMAMASFAQCKYEKNEVDKFTKDKVVITKARIVIHSAAADAMRFRHQGESYFLDLSVAVSKGISGVCNGSELNLLLSDSSVVTFTAVSGGDVDVTYNPYGNIRILHCTYAVAKDDLLRLAEVPVNSIRIHYCDTYEDTDISKPVKQEKVQKAVSCLLKAG